MLILSKQLSWAVTVCPLKLKHCPWCIYLTGRYTFVCSWAVTPRRTWLVSSSSSSTTPGQSLKTRVWKVSTLDSGMDGWQYSTGTVHSSFCRWHIPSVTLPNDNRHQTMTLRPVTVTKGRDSCSDTHWCEQSRNRCNPCCLECYLCYRSLSVTLSTDSFVSSIFILASVLVSSTQFLTLHFTADLTFCGLLYVLVAVFPWIILSSAALSVCMLLRGRHCNVS